MTQKEKLLELIGTSNVCFECFPIGDHKEEHEALADHLLANGVVVLPCRCEECHYNDDESHDKAIWCNFYDTIMEKDCFCSRGKRKGGDE